MKNRSFVKTIFIISLCLSSTFTTVAAISISDGSAYVTKAEFSADLNNLSNRMSQLENSLDSKIDSLVSSYLSKNGIWNANKVNIDYSYTDLSATDFIVSWNSYSNLSKEIWSKTAGVEKSGMCIATIHTTGLKNGNSGYRCYLRYFGGSWAGFEDDVRMLLYFNEIVNGVSYNRNVQQIGNSAQRVVDGAPGSRGECVVALPADQDTVLIGFVSKGNSIKVGMTQYVSDFQSGDSAMNGAGIGGDSRYRIQINSCYIY